MIPEYIVVHHSLTDDSGTVSWGAIRRYHTQSLGWRDIGYHFGIELVGDHYEVLLGRWWDEPGAHAKELGMNGRSLGICLIGNFDVAPPPEAQVDVARKLVSRLLTLFRLSPDRLIGHRDVGLLAGFDWRRGQYKSCPGLQFPLDALRVSLVG